MSMDKIEGLVAEFEAMRKEFQARAQVTFKEAFKEFWEKHPNIEAVVWSQYTPYFNDGDPCEFSVHDMNPLTKRGIELWDDGGPWSAEEYTPLGWVGDEVDERFKAEITAEEAKSATDSLRIINRLPDEVFELIFGDHVQITATRKGFKVEECDHD